jgi:hypothetical protein
MPVWRLQRVHSPGWASSYGRTVRRKELVVLIVERALTS